MDIYYCKRCYYYYNSFGTCNVPKRYTLANVNYTLMLDVAQIKVHLADELMNLITEE